MLPREAGWPEDRAVVSAASVEDRAVASLVAASAVAGACSTPRTPDAAITEALQSDAPDYRWVAAAIGSNSASGYQLATGDPVMAIGGFNGTDPAPALAAFERYVSEGDIHYFIAGGGFGGARA